MATYWKDKPVCILAENKNRAIQSMAQRFTIPLNRKGLYPEWDARRKILSLHGRTIAIVRTNYDHDASLYGFELSHVVVCGNDVRRSLIEAALRVVLP